MGWTFYHKPKGIKAIDSIKQNALGREWCEKHFVAASASFGAVHVVAKFHEPDSKVYVPDADGMVRVLLVFAIKNAPKARDGFNFGYKDMEESMGPYGCPAPLNIIAQCSELQDPIGPLPEWSSLQSARNYRAGSAQFAAMNAVKRKLKPGNKVTLAKPLSFRGIALQRFKVEVCRLPRRKGLSTVFRAENGMLCRLSAYNLQGAVVEA